MRGFIKLLSKAPNFLNPYAAVPISRDDCFIKKSSRSGKKNTTLAGELQTPPELTVLTNTLKRSQKPFTLVKGFPESETDIDYLARFLLKSCGSTGTVKDREIRIRGDFREQIILLLMSWGYKVS